MVAFRQAWPSMLVGFLSLAPLAALLFGCAGRLDLPWFWAYLGVWAVSAVVGPLVTDPTLLSERLHPGPGAKDPVFTLLMGPLFVLPFIVAGLDVRFHWSSVTSATVRALGLAVVATGLAVTMWALAVNRFFSSVIRIQTERGHRVISSGPYRWVRHPGYAAAPLVFVGMGYALGSRWEALAAVPLMLGVLRRTIREDRVLHDELPGYRDYAAKVRYRLLPGVW